jgi:hypothetical protein
VRPFQNQVLLREGKVCLSFFSFSRYFVTPTDKQQQAEEKELLSRIFEESFATHFWSRLTAVVVPEKGSLVETILNQYCLHCTDILRLQLYCILVLLASGLIMFQSEIFPDEHRR